jgi:trans-aconitate methyltransferase
MDLIQTFNQLEIKTDKGTTHDYLNGYYNQAMSPYKDKQINLLEIGIHRGASMILWNSFFTNAKIVGLDNEDFNVKQEDNNLIKICDAYSDDIVNFFDDEQFDFIIDDGPHTLQSQLTTIKKYLSKVKPGGKLIIEDIQSELDLLELVGAASDADMEFNVFDLRNNKGRYDDIILEIIKK